MRKPHEQSTSYSLPVSWNSARLEDLAIKVQDGTHFSPRSQTGPFRYLTSKNIRFGNLDIRDCGWISQEEHSEIFRRCDVVKGDVLLTKDGANTGNAALNSLDEPFSLLSSVAMIRCNPARLHASYLLQYLLLPATQKQLKDVMSGNAISRITLEKIKALRVIGPQDTNEQRRIAAVLDTVDEAIAQTEAVIVKLKQVHAGLLYDLLARGLDEHGQLRDPIAHPEQFQDSPLGRIPREWEVVFVDDLCSQVVDCPHSTPTYVSDGIPCIRTADMLPGQLLLNQTYRVTEEIYRERTVRLVPQEGDIIYSREGERLGIASPVGPERVCLGQRVMHLRPNPETSTDYLVWAMNAPAFYRQALVRIGATTSPHINVGDIRKFVLLRPPPTEQRLIGQTFRACDRLARVEEAQLAKYRLIKQGLMTDLLTGRVRVPEEFAVAS